MSRLSSSLKQLGFFLLFFLSLGQIHAQLVLVHEHENPKKRTRYFVGSPIEYINKDGLRLRGYVESIQDSSVIISGAEERIAGIRTILHHRPGIDFLSKLALAGAVFYVGLDFINAVSSRSRPFIGQEVLPVGLVLTGSGLLLHTFRFERRKVSDKRKLKLIDTSPN